MTFFSGFFSVLLAHLAVRGVAIASPGNFELDFVFVHVSVVVFCFVQCQKGVGVTLEVLLTGLAHLSLTVHHLPFACGKERNTNGAGGRKKKHRQKNFDRVGK